MYISKSPNIFTDSTPAARSTAPRVCRTLTEDDLIDAKAMVGWQFWAPPVIFTVGYFVAAGFAFSLGVLGEVICFLFLGGLAAVAWVTSTRQYKKFARDIGGRLVQVVEGAPERVFMTRFGRCYVRISGRKIRISNDYFSELRNTNNIKIDFLPESLIAIRVDIVHGIR